MKLFQVNRFESKLFTDSKTRNINVFFFLFETLNQTQLIVEPNKLKAKQFESLNKLNNATTTITKYFSNKSKNKQDRKQKDQIDGENQQAQHKAAGTHK